MSHEEREFPHETISRLRDQLREKDERIRHLEARPFFTTEWMTEFEELVQGGRIALAPPASEEMKIEGRTEHYQILIYAYDPRIEIRKL